jgi:hypothetical protein
MISAKTKKLLNNFIFGATALVSGVGLSLASLGSARAVINPQNGSIGLEGNITAVAPTSAATISTPSQGQIFTSNPITVAGVCQNGLIIEIYDNNIFAGSVACDNGSYSLEMDLFNSINALVAQDYNSQNQQGPDSATVTVTFNGGPFTSFATQFIFTTPYARRGANVDQLLTWPINVSGGTPPYAISANWGDGSKTTLLSQSVAGQVTLTHSYSSAGTYQVTTQGTDKNNDTAFLQMVAVISGPAAQSTIASATPASTTNGKISTVAVLALIFIILLLPFAFWLGRKHQVYSLRKRLEESERSIR